MNCGKKISQKVALEGWGFEPNFSVKLTFSNQDFQVPEKVRKLIWEHPHLKKICILLRYQ